eukprot:TRINITY_DN19227_c0_g1_i1.p1 TRINITY_DN19227_c0_g1~~TRINITY_DN19227_c0_g1_i1.p1  ORF type:complete len:328 (+),score=47.18 TRINITY_DN19227_c0_g1_i1:74-985(+)
MDRAMGIQTPKVRMTCGNRCLRSPDYSSAWSSFGLIVFPTVVFIVFVLPELTVTIHPILPVILAYSIALNIASLFVASGMDPGIFPRRPPGPIDAEAKEKGKTTKNGFKKNLIVGENVISVKYCNTCHFWRPPACSHCSTCNHCVDRFDHHCPWVGNCIGKRNYPFFVVFVLTTNFNIAYQLAFSATHLTLCVKNGTQEDSIDRFISCLTEPVPKNIIPDLFLLLYGFGAGYMLVSLCCYTLSMIYLGTTTHLNIQASKRDKRKMKGAFKNLWRISCFPWRPTFIDITKREVIPTADLSQVIS